MTGGYSKSKAELTYKFALSHIDEMKDAKLIKGEKPEMDNTSTKDYRARTPGILTSIQNDITMYLGMEYLDEITSMESDVELDDAICATIVVYELCARLLLTEDTVLSNYFSSLASNLKNTTLERYRAKAKQEVREDVYGSLCEAGD